MPQSSKKASSSIFMKRLRPAMEEDLRRQFTGLSPDEVKATDEMRLDADRALASVPALERLYLKDGNPVHVWDAILQISSAMRLLGKTIPFPPWVLAYLVRASVEIMGKAVAGLSDGDRQLPKEPERHSDGTTRYSDYFQGLSAAQRRDSAMEALGFKGAQGANPFAQAHRDWEAELLLSRIDEHTSGGLSVSAAAHEVNDPRLNMVDDPERKIRRDRKRLGGGET